VKPRVRLPLWVSLGRSQIASLTATVADFCTLILLVEFGQIWYVAATVIGAFAGAVVNFILGRHWSFEADHEGVRGQAIRYALVSSASLVLNSLGVYLLTEYAGLHYTISKGISALLVGILVNFPLHRRFVFRTRKYA
jgi:putative flippase GtrA